MWHLAVKTALVTLVPKALNDVYDWFMDDPKPTSKKVIRKKADTTQITQRMHDYICEAHIQWLVSNEHPKLRSYRGVILPTQQDFVDAINTELAINKSATTMAMHFNGHILRSSLPTGPKLALNLPKL